MDYLAVMFLSHLAHVTEEVRFVDGIEQPCLVIPTKTNQMNKGRTGNWALHFIFKEQPPNPKGYTHIMQLIYENPGKTAEAKRKGTWEPTMRMGRLFAREKGKKYESVDRTNYATEIRLEGTLILSDIPKNKLVLNKNTGKRLLGNLTIKANESDTTIFTGAICVDDIPKDRINTDLNTGKKYIHIRFLKMNKFDVHGNTHILVLVSNNSSEIEIGRFKEWVKEGKTPVSPPPSQQPNESEIHDTGVNQRQTPESIDGLKF